ncbi:hypothetical protein [Mucilaginibacter xinganensis]|uniref:Uncharacterized protein n=1 Tax=Mucilaginibacter xinganensis TaxID=1234841 RepID=A0A223NY07_9SPHI|nr:hypothetical protein [Mucilaginibacter xinganensis]ASU34696.1 hypothetical protein MuYL_2809 [Mucilaginibacter xinganensis]
MDSFEVITKEEVDNAEYFLKNLFQPGSKPYDLLKSALDREFRPQGAPDVTRITIDRVKYQAESGKGSFRVLLDINFTFGCEDLVTEKKDQTSEWTFFADKDNQRIVFYGSPYVDSRSTADEF